MPRVFILLARQASGLELTHGTHLDICQKMWGGFPGDPVAKTAFPMQGAQGLIPGQGTRSHMPQLRVHMPQLKILSATTKTWCNQINE